MVPTLSRYRSGTILLGTKAISSKRMRKLMTLSVPYMLSKRYRFHTQLYTNVKCFSLW